MSAFDLQRRSIKNWLFLIGLLIPELVFSQNQTGRIFSSVTRSPISYVNIVVMGRNTGTVSDKYGIFIINLDKTNDFDTLRFSMIGYKSRNISAGQLRNDSLVYLDPETYFLKEVAVVYHKPDDIRLGFPVNSEALRSGFAYNDLGSEMGIKVWTRRRLKLKDLHLDVAVCTYDSVTYRLNIYQSENKTSDYKNILSQPVYISFSNDEINKELTFDLRKYSIIVEGDLLFALELYKDLGEGRLLFNTAFFTGTTFHRKTSEGKWIEASGMIGMYLHGQSVR